MLLRSIIRYRRFVMAALYLVANCPFRAAIYLMVPAAADRAPVCNSFVNSVGERFTG
jgi:hypothetical protein